MRRPEVLLEGLVVLVAPLADVALHAVVGAAVHRVHVTHGLAVVGEALAAHQALAQAAGESDGATVEGRQVQEASAVTAALVSPRDLVVDCKGSVIPY